MGFIVSNPQGIHPANPARLRPGRSACGHVIFEPLDFIAGLAALVPKPRVNLTGFHGVLTVSVFYGWSKRLKREESVGAGAAFSRVMVVPSRSADFRLRFPCGLVLEWSGEADSGQLARLVKSLA